MLVVRRHRQTASMAQSIVGLVVGLLGIHMLRAAHRHRALPEAWIGLFFVASAIGSETALRGIVTSDPVLALRLLYIGIPTLTVATIAAYAFTYTVFRRGERWARAIVAAGVLLALWGSWYQLSGPTGEADRTGLGWQFLIGRFACFAWSTCEASRAYAMARRRFAFGLADPVVVNRFLLFGVWFAAMGVMPLTLALARAFGGESAQLLASGIGPKIVGLVMITALVLTFFPPRRYLDWLATSTAKAES
jgi:hypothetical protein